MKEFAWHSACPECDSSDGFAVYEHGGGVYSGHCFVCGHNVSEADAKRTSWEPSEPVTQSTKTKTTKRGTKPVKAKSLTAFKKSYRKAPKECWNEAGVGHVNPDTIAYPYYKLGTMELVGYKNRGLTLDSKGKKRMWIDGSITGSLFNPYLEWAGEVLVLTEGEDDAVVGAYMAPDYYFMSIPNGTNSKLTDDMIAYLKKNWKVIVLAFDSDEPGVEAAKAWQEKIGRQCKIAYLNHGNCKDACDYWLVGRQEDFIEALETAEGYQSKLILSFDALEQAVHSFTHNEEERYGVPTGIAPIDEITGLREGEISVLLGDTGTGKSTLFRVVIANRLKMGGSVLLLSLEERPAVVATRVLEHIYQHPIIDSDLSGKKLDKLLKEGMNTYIKNKLYFANLAGMVEPTKIQEVIEDAILSYGVRLVCFDGITVSASGAASAEQHIRQTMVILNAMALQHPVHVMAISHKSRGGDLDLYGGYGSSAIEDFAHMFFVFTTHSTDETKRYVEIAKNRLQGRKGKARVMLRYNEETMQYE